MGDGFKEKGGRLVVTQILPPGCNVDDGAANDRAAPQGREGAKSTICGTLAAARAESKQRGTLYNAQGPQTGDVHLRIRSRFLIHGFDLGCKGREFLLELLHELRG
jgi:hypothetical protein